jgi:hypothetical protein
MSPKIGVKSGNDRGSPRLANIEEKDEKKVCVVGFTVLVVNEYQ